MEEPITFEKLMETKALFDQVAGPPAEVWVTPSIHTPYCAEITTLVGKVILMSQISFARLPVSREFHQSWQEQMNTLLGMRVVYLP